MATSPILRSNSATLRRQPELARRKPVSPYSPKPLATAIVSSDCGASAPPPENIRSTKPATELVGIARLAASSLRAEAKCGTEYFLLPVRSILNHCNSERVPFRWTVNPYRGCEFGCKYCYARYTHEYMELDGAEFETKIYVKKDAGPLVERDLSCERVWGEHIAIGTATDPYQPAEREFGATRAILEKMAEREGLSLSITTKSNQVLRDIDLLRAHLGEIGAQREPERHDAEDSPCASARAEGTETGFAPRNCPQAAAGRHRGWRARDASLAGANRQRRRSRRPGPRR